MSSLINSTKLISPTFISPEIIIFGYFMGIVELVIHPIIFCFSFINISILITTNILHPNLWLLLVFQSTIISTFEIQRFTMVLLKFTGGDIFRPGDQILQITENIRTSRQLAPVFICHLLNNFCYAILTYLVYFNIITQPPYKLSLCYAVLFVFTSIIEGIIEITVLTHHPALRKTLLSRIKRLFSFKLASIRPISSTNSNINFKKEIFNSIKNIQGEQLISKTNIDEHFKMLLESWN
uniref:7TM_GPCR_Srx domain-containing protein n=1 Tax=Meloidogyne hapla TaxID=6305 RepID=A0A1I8BCN7_MELHA